MAFDKYIMETMFEQSLFSDLSLAFFHSAIPCTMRFDVHQAIVGQSPFLRLLLDNTHRINSVDNTRAGANKNSDQHSPCSLQLTIDLIEAMTLRGFLMAPSQPITRRHLSTDKANHTTRHILSSHLRFVLKWLYSVHRLALVDTLTDDDTLRVLSVAILFDLDPLVDACLERYTKHQLSIHTIVSDLTTIGQLPRDHKAYHRLSNVALLLLLRYGPDHPQQLARLPVDYMADVLSADMLFIGCEYERYRLLLACRFDDSNLEDPSSDKATLLSSLLRTTVNYSNMTFDELSIVLQDGVVDETIVFKALWQREALERLLFPFHSQQSQLTSHTIPRPPEQLLGAPQFRFSASVQLNLPQGDRAGWRLGAESTRSDDEYSMDDDDMEAILSCESITSGKESNTTDQQQQQAFGTIYNKTVYSDAKYILGHWHRVRVEAQVLPRCLVQIQDDNSKSESSVLVCRFELQRDLAEHHTSQPYDSSQQSAISTQSVLKLPSLSSQYREPAQQQSKIRYAVYCLNQHEGLLKNRQVDREDRVLVPVSDVVESIDPKEQSSGYVGQVLVNTDTLENNTIDLDMMVALEIFGFTNDCS